MRKILRQPLLNAAVAACGVIDKSDPPPASEMVYAPEGRHKKQIVAQ